MYLYYDRYGTLKEVIYEAPFRVGNVNSNTIYFYYEELTSSVTSVTIKLTKPDGTSVSSLAVAMTKESSTRVLPSIFNSYDFKFFEKGTYYQFYSYTLDENILGVSGTWNALFTLVGLGLVCSVLTFNVESNALETDTQISGSQFTYLTGLIDENIKQYSTIPAASSSLEGEIVQYSGTTSSTWTNGYFYKCVADGDSYGWTQINVQPETNPYRVSTLPTASSSLEGEIYQYVGDTGTYTKGFFYECIASGSSYTWSRVSVQQPIYRHTITLSVSYDGAVFSVVFNYVSTQSSLSSQGLVISQYMQTNKLTLATNGTYTYGSNSLQVRFIKYSATTGNAIFVYDTSSGLAQDDISITGATITTTSVAI